MLENYTRTEEGKYHQGQCCLPGGLLPGVPSPALKPWSLKVPDTLSAYAPPVPQQQPLRRDTGHTCLNQVSVEGIQRRWLPRIGSDYTQKEEPCNRGPASHMASSNQSCEQA